jgi:YidC/Oxa1 family membrane protein insertase
LQSITNALTQLFNWINGMVPDYGLDIILFTLVFKIVLLPFNIAQTKSMVKTQKIQPKLKELQNKYKNDPQKLQEAQMALYKSEGFNPLSGCLPLLIQLPILIAVFNVFRAYPFGNATFLDMKLMSVLKENGIAGILFAVVSGLTTFISTWILTPKNKDAGPASSNSTNIIMAVVFGWMSWTMPVGLVIYWVVNNILQLVIQYILNKVLMSKEAAENK